MRGFRQRQNLSFLLDSDIAEPDDDSLDLAGSCPHTLRASLRPRYLCWFRWQRGRSVETQRGFVRLRDLDVGIGGLPLPRRIRRPNTRATDETKELNMSKASKSSASEHMQLEGYEGHFEDFGPYTVG